MKKLLVIVTMAFGLTVFSAPLMETQAQTTVTKKKTGWSHRKKYAVIGGAAGAVTGAAVSKHRVKGAVIGGAVGAGAGYLLGRHRDKKHPQRKRIYKTKTTS
jgi:hypothetical protein